MWFRHLIVSLWLPRFTTVVCHFGGRNDILPSSLLFLRHSVNQFVSRFYGAVVEGVASYRLVQSSVRPGT